MDECLNFLFFILPYSGKDMGSFAFKPTFILCYFIFYDAPDSFLLFQFVVIHFSIFSAHLQHSGTVSPQG